MLHATRARQTRGPHREHHAAAVEPSPKTHPRLFTADGKRKWKVPPHGVKVEKNKEHNGTWIERWLAPKTKKSDPDKWVYNYTVDEVQRRAGLKFAQNRELARHIPAIRAQVRKDLDGGSGKTRETAMALTLIDRLCLRVGGEDGAEHDHFGATTLQKQHVHVEGSTVRLKFVGKSGVDWDVSLHDATFARLMKEQLHTVHGKESRVFAIHASDVNAYLEPFGATAKKFRTFHATRLAREELLRHRQAPKEKRTIIVNEMFEHVAKRLGHTPEVDRQSYVDPMVVRAFMLGRLA